MPPAPRNPLDWLRSVLSYVTSPIQRDQGPGQAAAGNALRLGGAIPDVRPLVAPARPVARPTSSAGPLVTHDQARVQAEAVNARLTGRMPKASTRRVSKKR